MVGLFLGRGASGAGKEERLAAIRSRCLGIVKLCLSSWRDN